MQYFVETADFNHKNLRICYLRTGTPKKFADLRQRNESKNLRFADLGESLFAYNTKNPPGMKYLPHNFF